ncbi:MAG: transcriptional regulator [Chlamydiia bacterium]|nr:transcriptional regulator [Chlamydiia bacterium]
MKYKKIFNELENNIDYINLKIREAQKKVLKDSKIDVTHKQYIYARLVERIPGCTFTQLFKYVSVSKGTFSTQLKTLAKKGHIVLKHDISNKKEKVVYLTDKGKKLVLLKENIEEVLGKKLMDNFDDEKIKDILELTRELVKAMH